IDLLGLSPLSLSPGIRRVPILLQEVGCCRQFKFDRTESSQHIQYPLPSKIAFGPSCLFFGKSASKDSVTSSALRLLPFDIDQSKRQCIVGRTSHLLTIGTKMKIIKVKTETDMCFLEKVSTLLESSLADELSAIYVD